MSIKTKLSLISMFILLIFIPLYYTTSDYYSEQQFHSRMNDYVHQLSKQFSGRYHLAEHDNQYENDGEITERDIIKQSEVFRYMMPAIRQVMFVDSLTGISEQAGMEQERFMSVSELSTMVKKQSEELLYIEKKQDNTYRSYYHAAGMAYSVVIDFDKNELYTFFSSSKEYRWWLTAIFLLIATIIHYKWIGVMMYPLKDILWKVNEVSSVRFQKPITIKSKDEFGLLSLKINAMSQNLSIYMNKLKKAFEENKQMKEHLESFINHSNDAIHIIDLNGLVIQVNRAFEQLFGYQVTDLNHIRFPTIPPELQEENRRMLDLLLKGKELPPLETQRMTKSGEIIPVSVTVSPIRDSKGTIRAFASICRDMRSRNKMEELLRRSEKLTTVGQLAAGVAHEIRNPLTTLRGFLQLQQQSKQLNLSHVNLMLSELDRINLIVGEFLILAKPQATKFVVKDVRDILQDVLVFLDSEAHLHNIEFVTALTEDDCSISCEENQLKQVFINLLKNAIEAMPSGGAIYISIQKNSGSICISIRDEGVGIPEEFISKIGDPFFTAKETGTGLGIMVSQRIINTHQGTLDIDSQVDFGTTVRLTLPALKRERLELIL